MNNSGLSVSLIAVIALLVSVPIAFEAAPDETLQLFISSAPNPALPGEQVTLSYTLTTSPTDPAPTGTVTFIRQGEMLGITPVEASAAGEIETVLPEGSYIIVGSYTGNLGETTHALVQFVGTFPGNLGVMPSSLNFGERHVSTASSATISIRNLATAEFEFAADGYTLSGPHMDDFDDIVPPPLDPIGASDWTSFPVGFVPTGLGLRQAELTFHSADPALPSTTVLLQGTAFQYSTLIIEKLIDPHLRPGGLPHFDVNGDGRIDCSDLVSNINRVYSAN